ncbi:hypothetical protein [Streptomyces malaysiensis]|uniref:Uncharacterized protein n=1 Tax=Streptomyces malaysiensis subsp. samsunensis TaxID=459658 RepID=A0A9X2M6C7_STRMQ|nr:hypothetical protein [Streptomyces samsunensis]MCQ8836302.1 hypothetical protein [Streptomyces samsunensis]
MPQFLVSEAPFSGNNIHNDERNLSQALDRTGAEFATCHRPPPCA